MKIVIDARMISWTGIGRVTKRLLDELQVLDKQNDYVVLLQKADFENWDPKAGNFTKQLADFRPYSFAEQWGLLKLLRQLKPDLVHFMAFNLPVLYSGRFIVTVNDLTLVEYPTIGSGRWPRPVYYLRHWAMLLDLSIVVRRATAVITISRYVKKQLVRRYHLREDRVFVTHLGVDPPRSSGVKPIAELQPPFTFYVGNPYPHKNLGRLLEAFKLVRTKIPELKLVIISNLQVGNTRPFYEQLKSRAKSLGLGRSVVFPGYIADQELAWLYRNAELFVFPSLSEGFGLPPLEAMSYGTPVITSNSSSLPEVCSDAAAYFNPTSVEDMADSIVGLLGDRDELKRLSAEGPKQAAYFNWRRTAEQTLNIYRSLQK